MSEFEDKLGAILGNPDAMAQIMSLAQTLSPSDTPAAPAPEPAPSQDITSLLGGLDPALLQSGMQLFSQIPGRDDEKTALLLALKPFLKPERYAKVDRAVQIARLSRVLRVGFQLFKGRGFSDV